MKRTLTVLALTLLIVALLDGLVAMTLNWAEQKNQLSSLVRYFEYGRSVPGKLERWQAEPDMRGNLFDVAWREDSIRKSRVAFTNETPDAGPVIRSYGMSFVNNVIKNSVALQPSLTWDSHSGPGAPPNYTYALFEDDHQNRRTGDIVVFGILSSAVPAMAALSNRTWSFEQPAPFTYPVYLPQDEGLKRINPYVTSADQERRLKHDPLAAQAWKDQLRQHDAFYAVQSHGAKWLDHSPFARLVRRSAATSHVSQTEAGILQTQSYPYKDALQSLIKAFAARARADGQMPVVMLIQTRDPSDADILTIAKPILKADDIPYFATVEHFAPSNPSGFLADGHYKPTIDRQFGEQFLNLITR